MITSAFSEVDRNNQPERHPAAADGAAMEVETFSPLKLTLASVLPDNYTSSSCWRIKKNLLWMCFPTHPVLFNPSAFIIFSMQRVTTASCCDTLILCLSLLLHDVIEQCLFNIC